MDDTTAPVTPEPAAEDDTAENPHAHLPEPIRLTDTITSADVTDHPTELDDDTREREWLIRTAGGF